MHAAGGKKGGSSEADPAITLPADGHDASTIVMPTTDLLPLLSEAHTARVESEFEDVPEVVAEISASPPPPFLGLLDEDDDTVTGIVEMAEWPADPLTPIPILYEGVPDVLELDEDDLPELVAQETVKVVSPASPPLRSDSTPSPHTVGPAPGWLDLVEEVVELIGEMEEDAGQLHADQPDSAETCRHVAVRLTLMLARNGVTVIGIKEQGAVETIMGQTFDRARHQPAATDVPAEETRIIEVVSPGFAVGQRVLRRARVRCQ